MGVVWTVLSAMQGLWVQSALNGVMVVAGPIVVSGLKRTASLSPWFQITMGCALLLYGPGMLGQSPFDETGMFFSVIIPLVAGFIFGGRSALRWTLGAAVVTVGSLLLAHAGYTLHAVDPTPLLTKSLNIVSTLAMTALFAASFHTVRRDALARAQAAVQAKGLFLASISHEIRTPMNGVLGMTEVMLSEAKDPASREQLEVIHRSGQLLVSLINDLLDFTKLEAQRLKLEDTDFDLHAVLNDVGGLFAPMARERGVTFEVKTAEGLGGARRGDSLRLRQVLFNLVSNALKFTEKGGVTLSVKPGLGEQLEFSVQDTGIGISPEVQSRLFSVFEQADASTTRRFGGTGLGLALARQLVELMGGVLSVESQEGAGSRFFFVVPLAVGKVTRPRLFTPPMSPGAAALRVLVVDDNPINLKVATSLVLKAGHQVTAASSGAEAVALASVNEYLVVLMDCHMPTMDGFEATRRIRALPAPHGTVPIIALTASTSDDDHASCRLSGMNEVLAKPVSLVTIQELLANLRRERQGRRAS